MCRNGIYYVCTTVAYVRAVLVERRLSARGGIPSSKRLSIEAGVG